MNDHEKHRINELLKRILQGLTECRQIPKGEQNNEQP